MEDKNIDTCLELNIQALIDAGYIQSKEDLSDKELADLKKVIEHAKCEDGCDCK